ncbi:Uncharacterised protein [uncultured archaeon]|nr:Uncharacterised protein [uncultured archaeon]
MIENIQTASKENIKEIRRKEKMNPSIQLYTYNDLLAFMESTVKFVRMLKNEDNLVKSAPENLIYI